MTIRVPNILLPNKEVDLTKWAVVACDQFTSEPKYWQEVEKLTEGVPSALHVVLPEIFLDKASSLTPGINDTMKEYLNDGTLVDVGKCFVLLDRRTAQEPSRKGLVLSIDLEQYSYTRTDSATVRATEGTVIERIPPRVAIRKDAPIELPHIMVLFNDKQNKIIGDLWEKRNQLEKLYDFDLNMNGGHLTGYKVTDCDEVISEFEKLTDESGLMFAVGDGNHSLATAKTCWDNVKQGLTAVERENHPARYALVEAVNIYDSGLVFEPIHRVVFNANEELIKSLRAIGGNGSGKLYSNGKFVDVQLPENAVEAVKTVQQIIDDYIKANPKAKVDYIHGQSNTASVVDANANSLGIILPVFSKDYLFEYVEKVGALPRKTFSMGEAEEKRYYLEAKKIK